MPRSVSSLRKPPSPSLSPHGCCVPRLRRRRASPLFTGAHRPPPHRHRARTNPTNVVFLCLQGHRTSQTVCPAFPFSGYSPSAIRAPSAPYTKSPTTPHRSTGPLRLRRRFLRLACRHCAFDLTGPPPSGGPRALRPTPRPQDRHAAPQIQTRCTSSGTSTTKSPLVSCGMSPKPPHANPPISVPPRANRKRAVRSLASLGKCAESVLLINRTPLHP